MTLFTAIAAGLGCFYAAASVHRGVIVKRGRISYDSRSESDPMPRADRWVGLPAGPTWLAWFNVPYVELLRSSLPQLVVSEVGGALLLRLGEEPMNADELAGRFPALPARLLARRADQPGRWEPEGATRSASDRRRILPKRYRRSGESKGDEASRAYG